MKKLEKLLDKLIGDKRPSDILAALMGLAAIVLWCAIGIFWAIEGNYLMLAFVTFACVWLVSVSVNKIFLKKISNYLQETPKATTLIFIIICLLTSVISWSHFIGVIISAILAFMFTNYIKNNEE